ncbi:hypothetical protein J8TS2_24310 [Lederbergia ruris]|uniref:DUF3102 domain-containing protein n=1 Tax=Lederbergia ruris TaxID=217495 RepID=A0ABQ4KL87_9BACI|nr:DUF3102 domain-containing protein [Lederbergia ruris]GIN58112.1 hypothetical protein J8TS2_24310 [Lederbergia ruris]
MTNEIKGGDTLELSSDINVITAEINAYQRVAGEAIFEIGRRLKHVRDVIFEDSMRKQKGEWRDFLRGVDFDITTAKRFIKVFEEFGEAGDTWHRLSMRNLYEIATLPPEQREAEHVTEKGETKKPEDMTVRELRELKKALKESEQAKEQAERQADIERSQRERLSAAYYYFDNPPRFRPHRIIRNIITPIPPL